MNRKIKQMISRIGGITLLAILAISANHFEHHKDTETYAPSQTRADIMDVHFIDVGQGDSILIETKDAAMLIDAGESSKGNTVADYLKSQNITELDYVIGTHPHSDHIGGLATILNTIKTDHVILPSSDNTTRVFEDVLNAIKRNNLNLTKTVVGDKYSLGPATFTIIAPSSHTYEESNNYSIGIKLTYEDNVFLFTGDAEELSEKEMLKSGIDLSADVLKLGDHGSEKASCNEFLEAVNPKYCVISAGRDNEYGYPAPDTLQAIRKHDYQLYRTDEQGTVVFTSNGKNISVNTQPYVITDKDLEN